MAEQQNTFYNYHPDIFHAVSGKSTDIENENFFYAVSRKSDTLEILNARVHNYICQRRKNCGERLSSRKSSSDFNIKMIDDGREQNHTI